MNKTIIKPGSTIGIIGGGQLGRMMALSAKQMGYRIAVLEPGADSPCAQVADYVIEASYDDQAGAKKLAEVSDVITYEFENIDEATAKWLTEHADFPQGFDVLRVSQHRLTEKRTIEAIGVPVAPYAEVSSLEDVQPALEKIGLPAVLKTCRGGYDGKGQAVVRSEQELEAAARDLLPAGELVLEGWIPFQCEVSVIVTRSRHGETSTFPVAENIHQNNILHQSIVPARITDATTIQAREIAMKLAEGLKVVGTLAVEMFVQEDGQILVNEIAPRPHNSGHYTIEACKTSQFEQQIRAVCGLPLGSTDLLKSVVMENLLGEHIEPLMANLDQLADISLHLYGKADAKEKRKMGHLTVLSESVESALTQLDTFKQYTNK
ncbi:5-(carboxyamino)imidazole ribonucleotide synthase [Alkalicoccobacillus porphyridii]|uniref:N5-carboxyaminoimidazole ribonucleotide synthase n=1 Tax=Alkalicoccobacillus porphyridii TaxID=2597270 RepID=A0A553ZWB2_9BACI|nr:5-(carboxyamino)imidazole ribonucleotide synthase [Alkalicoccobacillus porphyridii]TSB45635.1 5-(carboxyamino)imidazole ribonucleotide synthase [Alkalicoccobacillus porphyridii]